MAEITIMNEAEQKNMEEAIEQRQESKTKETPYYVQDPDGSDEAVEDAEENATCFLSLEDILGMDTSALTAEKQGHFVTEKLGAIPFTAISYADYKLAKKDCVTYEQGEDGVIQTKVDDDRLMTKIVILAVDKDKRSNFTFANKELLKKLGVFTAEGALSKLLMPGEVVNFAVAVQNASGFGNKAKKKVKDSVNTPKIGQGSEVIVLYLEYTGNPARTDI